MRHPADKLDITVPSDTWPSLVHVAGLDRMRARAARVIPGPVGILRDPAAFFRQCTSGSGAAPLTPTQLERYTAAAQRSPRPTCRPGSTGGHRFQQAEAAGVTTSVCVGRQRCASTKW
jgi:hypothetical protein